MLVTLTQLVPIRDVRDVSSLARDRDSFLSCEVDKKTSSHCHQLSRYETLSASLESRYDLCLLVSLSCLLCVPRSRETLLQAPCSMIQLHALRTKNVRPQGCANNYGSRSTWGPYGNHSQDTRFPSHIGFLWGTAVKTPAFRLSWGPR